MGTSNSDLNTDEYVRQDELLLTQDFEEFALFFKNYLTYMELYPSNDDDYFKEAISGIIAAYFKTTQQ